MSWNLGGWSIASSKKIQQCIIQWYTICNKNVNTYAYFCYIMVHCGIQFWYIVRFVQRVIFLLTFVIITKIPMKILGKALQFFVSMGAKPYVIKIWPIHFQHPDLMKFPDLVVAALKIFSSLWNDNNRYICNVFTVLSANFLKSIAYSGRIT